MSFKYKVIHDKLIEFIPRDMYLSNLVFPFLLCSLGLTAVFNSVGLHLIINNDKTKVKELREAARQVANPSISIKQ
jgi:hypothetical protein